MIVTCPSCDARYRADEAMIARRNGRVRCASCGHVWTVETEVVELREVLEAERVFDGPDPDTVEPLKPHEQFRQRAEARRRRFRRLGEGAAWGAVAACFLAFFTGAFLFRGDVVEAWPRAANAYAAVGLRVNPYGLEIEELNVARGSDPAAPALIVEGVVRNVTGRDRDTAPLAARLLDEQGSVILDWPVYLESPALPSGGEERFRTTLMELPDRAAEVEVVIGETPGALPAAPADGGTAEDAPGARSDATAHADASHAPR